MTTQQDLINALNSKPATSIGIPAATSANLLQSLQACVQAVNMLQGTTTIATPNDRAVRLGEFQDWLGTLSTANSQLISTVNGQQTLYETLTQQIDGITSTISTIQQVAADQAQLLQQVSVASGTAQAQIQEERTARIAADQATSDRITTVSATLATTTDNLSAQIQNEQTARVSADEAQAQQISSVTATANNNSISLSQQSTAIANINGKMSGEWVWSTTIHQSANARVVVGAKYGIDVNGTAVTTTLRFAATTFAISNGVSTDDSATAPFLITGGVVRIQSSQIQDASITNGKIQDAAITNAKIAGTISSNQLVNGVPAWSLNKDGAFTAQNATIAGNLTATSITGAIQSVLAIAWNGSLNSDTSDVSPTFTCPAPLRADQSHRPEFNVALLFATVGGNDATGCTVYLDRLNSVSGAWDQIDNFTVALAKFTQVSYAYVFLDNYHSGTTSYRFRMSPANNQPITLNQIRGRILGQRV